MSRYLEISVDGPLNLVTERAERAFSWIGKIDHVDTHRIEGVIKIDGEPAYVTVTLLSPKKNNRIPIEIKATSHDRLSRAADSALFKFANAYKSAGTPEPPPTPPRISRKQWVIGALTLVALWLLYGRVHALR
jgi:hypothetical protein